MTPIPEGCIFIARKIKNSEIWDKKPAWWLKVWLYILMKVNHKENNLFKRGENFFTYDDIYKNCRLVYEGNDTKSIDNLMRWLKRTTQITTRKTTRGFIISVCNYSLYQKLDNYKNDTENDTENDSETIPKRNRNDTINKNDKNDNKNNQVIYNILNDIEKYPYLKNEPFKNIFQSYLDMRIKIKKPATDKAKELVLIKLHKYSIETAIKMLENSIMGSWQGVFELKEQGKPQPLRGRLP